MALSGDFEGANTGKGLSHGSCISGEGGEGFRDIIELGEVKCVDGVCGVKLLLSV